MAGIGRPSAEEWRSLDKLHRAQHAAPLRRKWWARFSVGGETLDRGVRGGCDDGELTEQ